MEATKTIRFILNGEKQKVKVNPGSTLLDVLREELRMTGVKKGCEGGECGACTVLLEDKAVTSCIVPVLQVEGKSVLTIEGLAGEELHPLQQAFIEAGAVQCGYCTPGMILSAKALLDSNPHPTRLEVRKGISGNLCRCTGYKKIVDAVMLAAERMSKKVS